MLNLGFEKSISS